MNHRQHEAYFSGYDGLEKTRADEPFTPRVKKKGSGRVSLMIDEEKKMRICSCCHIKKPFSDFSMDNRRGITRAICKECAAKKQAKRYHKKTVTGIE